MSVHHTHPHVTARDCPAPCYVGKDMAFVRAEDNERKLSTPAAQYVYGTLTELWRRGGYALWRKGQKTYTQSAQTGANWTERGHKACEPEEYWLVRLLPAAPSLPYQRAEIICQERTTLSTRNDVAERLWAVVAERTR